MAGRKPGSSYAQALRVLELVDLARRGPWTITSLAVALGVTPRTVARDVAALRAARVRLHPRCDARRGPLLPCGLCGETRPRHAGDLCAACYRAVTPRPRVVCRDCREDKPHAAHGRCARCEERARRAGAARGKAAS